MFINKARFLLTCVFIKCYSFTKINLSSGNVTKEVEGESLWISCQVTITSPWISLSMYTYKLEKHVIGYIFNREGCENFGNQRNLSRYRFSCNMEQQIFKLGIMALIASDHDTEIGCVLKFSSLGEKEEKKTKLHVIVPAKYVTTNFVDKLEIEQGNQADILCTANRSRPAATINWFMQSTEENITIQLNDSSTERTFMDSDSLFNVESVFSYQAKIEDNGKIILCTAYNGWGDDTAVSAFISLDIKYGPITEPYLSTNKSQITVVEGESTPTISCYLDCNPACKVHWTKDNKQVGNENKLSIKNISASMAGIYICQAQNQYGQSRKEIHVIVSYIRLSTSPSDQICENGESTEIVCQVHEVARNLVFAKWKHSKEGQTVRYIHGQQNKLTNILRIPFCGYQDSGTYTCMVRSNHMNENTETTSELARLSVHGTPVISDFIKTIFNRRRNKTSVAVKFYSIPKPYSVEWIKDDKTLPLSEKYQQRVINSHMNLTFHNVKVEVPGYEADLVINRFEEKDYGGYILRVQNQKGSSDQSVLIVRERSDGEKEESMQNPVLVISVCITLFVVLLVLSVICVIIQLKRHKALRRNEGLARTTSRGRSSYTTHGPFDIPSPKVYDFINSKEINLDIEMKCEDLPMSNRSRADSSHSKSDSSGYLEPIS